MSGGSVAGPSPRSRATHEPRPGVSSTTSASMPAPPRTSAQYRAAAVSPPDGSRPAATSAPPSGGFTLGIRIRARSCSTHTFEVEVRTEKVTHAFTVALRSASRRRSLPREPPMRENADRELDRQEGHRHHAEQRHGVDAFRARRRQRERRDGSRAGWRAPAAGRGSRPPRRSARPRSGPQTAQAADPEEDGHREAEDRPAAARPRVDERMQDHERHERQQEQPEGRDGTSSCSHSRLRRRCAASRSQRVSRLKPKVTNSHA